MLKEAVEPVNLVVLELNQNVTKLLVKVSLHPNYKEHSIICNSSAFKYPNMFVGGLFISEEGDFFFFCLVLSDV